MSSNTDESIKDKNLQKAELEKQNAQRANDIKELAKLPDAQLSEKETQLWSEKQRFFNEVQPNVAQLKTTMRMLKQDLDKYGNVADNYKEICDKYNQATKAAAEKEASLNLKIQNIQAARQVKIEAKNIPVQNEIHEQAVKAAIEGQKPFTPQITPDQSFNISAVTQAFHNETSEQPKSDAQVKAEKSQKEQENNNKKSNTQVLSSSASNSGVKLPD